MISGSLSFCIVPFYGLGLVGAWIAILWVFGVLLMRYLQIVYSNYKFILFDIQIFEINPLLERKKSILFSHYEHLQIDKIEESENSENANNNNRTSMADKFSMKLQNYKTVIRYYFRNESMRFVVIVLVIALLSIIMPLLFTGVCIDHTTFVEKGLSIPFFGVSVSPQIFRSATFANTCLPGEPCHVYITLP